MPIPLRLPVLLSMVLAALPARQDAEAQQPARALRLDRVAVYGWSDLSDTSRPLTPGERSLNGGMLGSVRDVVEGEDGAVWILDNVERKVVIFAPEGALRRVTGGTGAGPGEFSLPSSLSPGEHGEVHVWDPRLARLSTFSGEGLLAGTRTVPFAGGSDPVVEGEWIWFVRALVSPRAAVVKVDIRTGAIVDSFARLDRSEASIAGFGSPGRLARFPGGGGLVYAGPRPVRFRILQGSREIQLGTDRYPGREGMILPRGTRITPLAVMGVDINSRGEMVMLYSVSEIMKDGTKTEPEWWVEVMGLDGISRGRHRLDVEGAHAIAWARNGDLLVGVTDEWPQVWRMRAGPG